MRENFRTVLARYFLANAAQGRRHLKHDPATHFIRIDISPVGQDHDTRLAAGHHADIGRCIVEAAILLNDVRLISGDNFPRKRLLIALITPLCANAMALFKAGCVGNSPRLAARKIAMSRGEENIWPVPDQ